MSKHPRINRDMISGVVVIIFAVAFLYTTINIPRTGLDDAFGSSRLPATYAWLLIGLGILLCIKSLVFSKCNNQITSNNLNHDTRTTNPGNSIKLFISTCIFLLLLFKLGYVMSTFLFLTITPFVLGTKLNPRLVLTSLSCTAAFYILFEIIFGISLPVGFYQVF